MMLPGERALRQERAAMVATVSSLSDEEFQSGPTLCEGWAPRDVLAHVIGVDTEVGAYLRAGGRINTANEDVVGRGRSRSREELLVQGHRWAAQPAPLARLAAFGLLGDVAIHHQDVLRPLGRDYEVPPASRRAILREGMLLGARRLWTHRIEPVDGGMAIGRGRVVRGTMTALGLWLAGRRSVEDELYFGT